MSTVPKHRVLPDKENKLFKELLTQYELKQYKKGIKAADTILKKFPNHGETIALKALSLQSSLPFPPTVSSAPKQEEAEAMARLAVKKDITSHITWHVLGIFAKNRKDWEEASRAFAMARKQDPDNIPVIRDSIALYLHTRQYGPAVAARHHYLCLRPMIRSSWLGLMIAHELNGDLEEALEVYDGYVSCVKSDSSTEPEKAQVCLHVVKMCMKNGDYEDALSRLERGLRNDVISPRGESTVLKAKILGKLGRFVEAEDTFKALLEQNPDCRAYYSGYLKSKGLDLASALDETQRVQVEEILVALSHTYPKSSAPRRLRLEVLQGDAFVDAARTYLISGLERGVPSLFVDLKGLYADPGKLQAIGALVEDIVNRLEKEATLSSDGTIEPPTTLLWAYYFLALHLAHPLNPYPSHQRALDLIEVALKHTPTLPELYMVKAMVLKRSGDVESAAYVMEEARVLDLQDRFLNSKAAKYWLRAGHIAKAEELLAMFSKKDVPVVADQTDLQCLWMMQEEGDAHYRNGNLALALKRYNSVFVTFQDYEDDQYDFHTYCLRRMTFSAYTSLLTYEDQLRSHPAYFRAALKAIDLYLRISDDPSLTEEKLTPEEEAERKKAAKKAQKAEQKAKKAAAAASDGKKDDPPVPDEDPNGEKLLKTETPLDDALKVWKPLEKLARSRIEVWTTGFDLYIRKKLYLAALRCLNEASAIDPEDPTLHRQILQFRRIVSSATDIPAPAKQIIGTTFPSILPEGTELAAYNTAFLEQHSASPVHIVGAAAGLLEIKRSSDPLPADTVPSLLNVLSRLANQGVPVSIPSILQGVEILQAAKASDEEIASFRSQCRERLPSAWVLASKDEQAKHAAELAAVPEQNGTVKADL